MPSLSRDVQINPLGTEEAPADFVLPAAAEIVPKMIFASFDGTAAGSSFVPLLEVISDSGHKAGRLKAGSTVAAGGSADVTWAPFLEEAAAAAAGTSLPYCDIGQFRNNFNPGVASQFRWTNNSGGLERNDPMFDYADAHTSLSINSEGLFMVGALGTVSFGNTATTSDRIIDWEFWTDSGWTTFGTFDAMGPLVTGRPFLGATPAANFAEYTAMNSLNFWVGTLAGIGLSALPLKIRPVLDINMGAGNPVSMGLSMFVTRLGNAPVTV